LKKDLIFYLLVNFVSVFSAFLFQIRFLSHQKHNDDDNTSGKMRQARTLQLRRMNQATTSFAEQNYSLSERRLWKISQRYENQRFDQKTFRILLDIQLTYTTRKQRKKMLLMKKMNQSS
jgi:hypothetical protein